jgi:hypothetical protein
MGNRVREIQIDIDKIRAEILADCAGKEVHGCDYNDYPQEYTPEEEEHFRTLGREWMEKLRKQNPSPWLGDHLSKEHREAWLHWTLGKMAGVIPKDEEFTWDPEVWK